MYGNHRLACTTAAKGHGATAISRELNKRGMFRTDRKSWGPCSVQYIFNNPKHYGCDVRNRTSRRLQGKVIRIEPQHWLFKPGACAQMISQAQFESAQTFRPKRADEYWSDKEILRCIRKRNSWVAGVCQ